MLSDIDLSIIIRVLSTKCVLEDREMASAKNKVIAGDYENKHVALSGGKAIIMLGMFKNITLDKSTVEAYEVVDETSRKSASSAVGRAAVGGLLFGPIGLAAGLSAKSKGTHTVAIQFKDGCGSLLEVDDKIYKAIVTKVF